MPHDAPEDRIPDIESWDLPDRLTWEECLDETAFPGRPGADRRNREDDE
ncbi:MAG: hypothetical protein K2X07_13605 [Caulobacteraceae bacterium]|nr:hypothetical protein [Caulobacteraceae bacterium]